MLYKVFYSFIMPPGGIISLLILFNIYLYWKKIKGKFIFDWDYLLVLYIVNAIYSISFNETTRKYVYELFNRRIESAKSRCHNYVRRWCYQ